MDRLPRPDGPVGQTRYLGILAWRDLSIYDGFRSRFATNPHSYRPINGNGQRRFDKGNTRGFQGFAFANVFDRIVRLDETGLWDKPGT